LVVVRSAFIRAVAKTFGSLVVVVSVPIALMIR
jgi:hypothetical protein